MCCKLQLVTQATKQAFHKYVIVGCVSIGNVKNDRKQSKILRRIGEINREISLKRSQTSRCGDHDVAVFRILCPDHIHVTSSLFSIVLKTGPGGSDSIAAVSWMVPSSSYTYLLQSLRPHDMIVLSLMQLARCYPGLL